VVLIFSLAHRNRTAWLILLPPVLIHLIWLLIKTLGSFSPFEGQLIAQIFISLYISIALLFALARRISRQNKIASFFLGLCVIALVGLATFFAYNFGGNDLSQRNRLALVFNISMASAFLLGLTMALFMSRKRFKLLKFIAALFVSAFLFTMVFIFCFGLYDFGPRDPGGFLVVGFVFGLLLCGAAVPFVILMFTCPFYRRTLETYLPQPPKPPQSTNTETEPKT
jgi:hypothetical protein